MQPILDSKQMKSCDENTMLVNGIPSMVLMERAALSVSEEIIKRFPNANIGVICGLGNNGGDGVAIARILHLKGFQVSLYLLGDSQKYTTQLTNEISIANSYNVRFSSSLNDLKNCDVIVDAIFGIGLSREVTGPFAEAISFINNSPAKVISVDIPSGFSADSGKILGCGVKADLTVTFSYMKKGLLLCECALNAGEIVVKDVGIYQFGKTFGINTNMLSDDDLSLIPVRQKDANKGTCGKVLVIAGSEEIYGACFLCAKAAMVTGSGLVKVLTHENNISSIQQSLPEAMYSSYKRYSEKQLENALSWADAVVIGPGLSTSKTATQMVTYVLKHSTVPVLVDADGLNILAKDISLIDSAKVPIILTPHLKEMSRLCGQSVSEIKDKMEEVACTFSEAHNCIVVLKNFTTLISISGDEDFINSSGNEAMATAGSGDVLAGIIASLLGQGLAPEIAAPLGAYLHGRAGEVASSTTGIRGLLASDIIDHIWL